MLYHTNMTFSFAFSCLLYNKVKQREPSVKTLYSPPSAQIRDIRVLSGGTQRKPFYAKWGIHIISFLLMRSQTCSTAPRRPLNYLNIFYMCYAYSFDSKQLPRKISVEKFKLLPHIYKQYIKIN